MANEGDALLPNKRGNYGQINVDGGTDSQLKGESGGRKGMANKRAKPTAKL